MPFDINTAVPVKETETNDLQPQQFDITTARPVDVDSENKTGYETYKKQEMSPEVKNAALQELSVEDLEVIRRMEITAPQDPGALYAGIIPYVQGAAGFFTKPFGITPFGDTFTPEELAKAAGEHPVATTIGSIIGGTAPFIALAPLFPQGLLGTIGVFSTVGGVSAVGRQQTEESLLKPLGAKIKDVSVETLKTAALAPIWHFSGALSFVGRPYTSAFTRAGARGAGTATLSKVFGEDLETALKEGGLITALSLIFEAPHLAKTALGRGIVKHSNRIAKEAKLPEGQIELNLDTLDAISTKASIFKLVKGLSKFSKVKGNPKITPEHQKFLGKLKSMDLNPQPPAPLVDKFPVTGKVPTRPVGTPESKVVSLTPGIIEPKVDIEIKAKQIKGRLTKLDSDIKSVRKEIDSLSKQKQELQKQGKSTKQIESKIDKLTMSENVIDSERAELLISQKETIALEKEKIEITAQELLKNIQKGIREGTIQTKKDIKTVQTELTDVITRQTNLDTKDKAKFIKTIKNIQTEEQLRLRLPEIVERVAILEQKAAVRDIRSKINKELGTTKPVKKGQRRVGKFDPDSNKLFDELRSFDKLTQEEAQAEFDKLPELAETEVDLIKKRFLSAKANGAAASLEIHNLVLSDIQKTKELGEAVKSEADLFEKINRQDLVDDALASIGKIKADKKTIKTKIGNVYRKGFSNISSMLNSIGGKKFAEKFNPELSENRRNVAVYRKTVDITLEASKIYNEKNILRMFETMSRMDYQITDSEGLVTDLSKLELIDIYNSIKNVKKREDYFEAFGEAQVQTLMANLTTQDKLFGDALQVAVQGYRGILNKRNIETTGRDLGFVENYWPATSEFEVSIFDDIRLQGETPSAVKERAKSRVIPVPRNAWYKAQKHIRQGEHVDKLSREFETLKRLFTDRKVKNAMTRKFGEDVYDVLLTQIDNISLNKQTERIDAISGIFQRAINNWVTAKIALNPSTYVRQLMSVGNYAEQMNAGEWTKGFFQGMLSPKETFKFVWSNAPFLEARFNKGFSEALTEAIKGAESISVNKKMWTKFLTSFARSGDITAIVYGGFPLIKAELAKHGDMKRAIDVFEQATLKAQQSGLSSSISQFQNSKNPFTRLFLAFKNTSNQFFRKMVDAVISFQNGDISLSQFSKTMGIYSVIQPILYVAGGYATKLAFRFLGRVAGLREDDEDFEETFDQFLNDVMIQMIVSPVNAIPIIDDVVQTSARKLLGKKIFKVFSTPLFDDLETGLRALAKEKVTAEDYMETTAAILEPMTAAPLKSGIRYFEILTGKEILKKKVSRSKIR